MRHKKKRSHTGVAAATANHHDHPVRNVDRLDYSDESSAADSPLDSQEYQRAIRAHLNEFEDMTANSEHAYSNRNGLDDMHVAPRSRPRSPSLPPLVPASDSKRLSRKVNKPSATNGGEDKSGKDRIWNTTTNEERERIKDFWLNLGEEERKSLVKVEKEAVLKKMKEQQKHSCSCSVCGRKRTAIEEELEVLYDAYYEELEQYANQQQLPSQTSISSSRNHINRPPRPGRITEVLHSDDSEASYDEEEEEDLSEDDLLTDDDLSDENEEEYSDEEYAEDHAPPEFFKFGNSLTVKGGILTVADDLLKNDGKKFIEMMEQLAERRMQREEEAAMEAREYDELDEEDYDDDDIESEDYDDDDDEQDALTEEQRMAEGRRMFQIFAARMFEQRVLTAYREKVAQERQAQLLQELEMEDSREKEREAKKLKEKEKKKDKKRQQQQKKEEDKAKKEAERLAEEAAVKAEEERKAEDIRKRKEDQRLKREAEKKAADAERARKEEEKRKRIAEEKARELKRQEQAVKEKRAKEEAQRKDREAKEAAAKEAKLKKEAAAKAQELAATRIEPLKNSTLHVSTPTTGSLSVPRKVSPMMKPASPAVGAPPAIPKNHASAKDVVVPPRGLQDPVSSASGPRNIPGPVQQNRNMTPGLVSPQQQHFPSHQNSFPRAALGHPPSMPVPLPPPGIGGNMHGPPTHNHDLFGFSSQNQHNHLPMQASQHPVRTNGHINPQVSNMQGPPGVFSNAPGLNTSTSPQARITTPQGSRLPPVNAFSAFSGLGASSGSAGRDELVADAETSFTRRPSNFADANLGAIGAIGRPPATVRNSSSLPAPIQRPTSIAPPKRSGFENSSVMGSRALLDDDDPVVDNRLPMSATSWTHPPSKSDWTGSAALNGTVDEPYHPPTTGVDRWGAAGTIGTKSIDSPTSQGNKSKWVVRL